MDLINVFKTLNFASYIWLLVLPVALMGIDVVTGLVNAWAKKIFKSTKMRSGLAKKVGEFMILLVGVLFSKSFGLPDWILDMVSFYIILMELMSIVENLDKLGSPLPKFVKNAINNMGEAVQSDDIEELNRKIAELERTITALKKG